VVQLGRFRFNGFFAWLMWLAVHLVYITGFTNRVTALMHWAVSFIGRGRAERTTTAQQVFARRALARAGDSEAEDRADPQIGDRAAARSENEDENEDEDEPVGARRSGRSAA
jgi:NADH dehydrogenase